VLHTPNSLQFPAMHSAQLCLLLPGLAAGLVVPLTAANPRSALAGVSLPRVSDGAIVDVGCASCANGGRIMVVLGTYPADFNMIEYGQRLRHHLPELKAKGIGRFLVVVNGQAQSCKKLVDLLDLPAELEVLSDPVGEAGRRFGVSRGWKPDDATLNPYLKLYIMLFGVGPPATLPAVVTGYLGNPSGRRAWIESALEQGQRMGRWPDNVLDLSSASMQNKFDELPLVGGWGRRPLELATLRLQNLKMAFDNWEALKPTDDRCLTQLGGCVVVGADGEALYSWIDNGICDVADFDSIIAAL